MQMYVIVARVSMRVDESLFELPEV